MLTFKKFGVVVNTALLVCGLACLASEVCAAEASAEAPQTLDLARFYNVWFITGEEKHLQFATIAGTPEIDGLPFDLRGQGCVYGEKEFNWNRNSIDEASGSPNPYPDFKGIVVGRKFEELHLLHSCRWADVQRWLRLRIFRRGVPKPR